ncbi:RasGEF domain-containing protein [Thiotrichales bacterium 19X7-9]|nr:RasGEF domain-containing protein [Thiotrichales bacterium 19X7-9]
MTHQEFLTLLAHMKKRYRMTTSPESVFRYSIKNRFSSEKQNGYQEQVKLYANSLDWKIRSKFAAHDLALGLNSQGRAQLNQALASDFDRITFRVISDILNANSIEDAARIYTFWLDVAVYAGNQNKNLHLENAIVLGLNQFYVDRIFSKGDAYTADKPGYAYLPQITKDKVEVLSQNQRYSNQLVHQTTYLPPFRLYSNLLETSKDGNGGVTLNDGTILVLSNMSFFQQKMQNIEISQNKANETCDDLLNNIGLGNNITTLKDIDDHDDFVLNKSNLLRNNARVFPKEVNVPGINFASAKWNIEKLEQDVDDDFKGKLVNTFNLLSLEASKLEKILTQYKDSEGSKKVLDELETYLMHLFSADIFIGLMRDEASRKLFETASGLRGFNISLKILLDQRNPTDMAKEIRVMIEAYSEDTTYASQSESMPDLENKAHKKDQEMTNQLSGIKLQSQTSFVQDQISQWESFFKQNRPHISVSVSEGCVNESTSDNQKLLFLSHREKHSDMQIETTSEH